jgi:cytosine/adenosine deaminase-related metal-dependent hydrolase
LRKIAATYIFPGEGVPLKNGLLLCEDDGTVIDLQEQKDGIREQHGVEFYSGIVVPGFVNTHCHLELSHLHNKLDKNKGIGHFVKQINQTRSYPLELIEKAINAADKKMWSAGIAAVGDIANTSHSLKTKVKSKIHYHTFIESFGFHPSRAERAFQLAQSVLMQFKNEGLSAGIVPHSPY